MAERCMECRFWLVREGQEDWGHCRRYPPAPVAGRVSTRCDDWCGEWSIDSWQVLDDLVDCRMELKKLKEGK